MVWACDADERREDMYKNATRKNGGNTTKRKTKNQIDKPNQEGYRNERGKLERNTRKQKEGEQRCLEISLQQSTHIFGND